MRSRTFENRIKSIRKINAYPTLIKGGLGIARALSVDTNIESERSRVIESSNYVSPTSRNRTTATSTRTGRSRITTAPAPVTTTTESRSRIVSPISTPTATVSTDRSRITTTPVTPPPTTRTPVGNTTSGSRVLMEKSEAAVIDYLAEINRTSSSRTDTTGSSVKASNQNNGGAQTQTPTENQTTNNSSGTPQTTPETNNNYSNPYTESPYTPTGNSFLDQLAQLNNAQQDTGEGFETPPLLPTPNQDVADPAAQTGQSPDSAESTKKSGMFDNMVMSDKILLGSGIAVVALWLLTGKKETVKVKV